MRITCSATRSASRSKRSPGVEIDTVGDPEPPPLQRGQPPPQAHRPPAVAAGTRGKPASFECESRRVALRRERAASGERVAAVA